MELVFSRTRGLETVKVVNGEEISGWCTTVKVTDLDKTTDSFFVVKKIHEAEDMAGNHYDWYEIKDHYRVVEHGERVHRLEEQAATIETAMCDTDAENEERLAEIELALCELDERG